MTHTAGAAWKFLVESPGLTLQPGVTVADLSIFLRAGRKSRGAEKQHAQMQQMHKCTTFLPVKALIKMAFTWELGCTWML
jgi:hypothetical protein